MQRHEGRWSFRGAGNCATSHTRPAPANQPRAPPPSAHPRSPNPPTAPEPPREHRPPSPRTSPHEPAEPSGAPRCDDGPAMTAPHPHARRPAPARAGGDLRVLRAAVFAAVCVVLAGAGHALASCAAVPLWTPGHRVPRGLRRRGALAGRERSLPGIAALLAVGQTVLHTLFGLGQHGATAASRTVDPRTPSDAALVERGRAARVRHDRGGPEPRAGPADPHRRRCSAGTGTAARRTTADAMHDRGGLLSRPAALPAHAARPRPRGRRRRVAAAPRRPGAAAPGRALSAPESALVRSLRGALALVRALRAGLPGAPGGRSGAPRAGVRRARGPADDRTPAHGDQARPAGRRRSSSPPDTTPAHSAPGRGVRRTASSTRAQSARLRVPASGPRPDRPRSVVGPRTPPLPPLLAQVECHRP